MIGEELDGYGGSDLDGSMGTVPGTDSPGGALMVDIGTANGFNGTAPYAPESYDAAALIMLAMASANSSDSQVFKDHVMKVANGPGEKIYPGNLANGITMASNGFAVDYVGGSAVTLIGPGESSGSFREVGWSGGKEITVQYR